MSQQTNWTPQQRQAIETVGMSLLVSAAAGSGKTSVLAERCIYLVCDCNQPCAIDELLVVTFTEAAAAEMKKRIGERVAERLKASHPSESRRLRSQLMLLDQANISTLHSFCLRLIRQHFHRLDLDPTARVIGEDEAALLRGEVVKQLFADHYETGDEAFTQFIEAYGDGRDEFLMELVLSANALMQSLVYPDEWRKQAIDRIERGANLSLTESELGREYLAIINEDLLKLTRWTETAIAQMPAAFGKYKSYLLELQAEIEDWQSYAKKGFDSLAQRVREFKPSTVSSYPNDTPGKDQAKGAVDGVKEAIADFRKLLAFSSEQWRAGLKSILPHAATFLSLVDEFSVRYQQSKRELDGLDFADQERFALRLLQIPEVASLCHAQFKHVLVDEYQDINSVQEAILVAASTSSPSPGTPGEGWSEGSSSTSNLFCVGDVKQSIYRFRLAEPGKFLTKSEAYSQNKGGRRIDLNSNFRSRDKLLDAINGVFRRLMSKSAAEIEYDQSHELNCGADYPKAGESEFPGSPIELHLLEKQSRGEETEDDLDRTQREALLIARRIHEMMGNDGSPRMNVTKKEKTGWKSHPIENSDIVILLRATTRKADQIADVLREQRIRVHTDRGGGFFDAVEIRDILSLLSLLDNQQQDVPLVALLRSPIASFDAEALAKIRLAYPDEPFHRAAQLYAQQKQDELGKKLEKFYAQLADWRELAQRRPLAEVVWKIFSDTGYLVFCAGLTDGEQRQANLLHFHQRCKQFGQFGQGLYRFLRFVEQLKQEQDTNRPAVVEVDQNAVRIMSIHAAKGLEFPVVFVPDLGKEHNPADTRGSVLVDRHAYLGLHVADEIKQIRYPSLAHTLVRRRKHREMLAEELRLLYVAMTRAKEHLILVGTTDLSAIEKWQNQWAKFHGAMPSEDFLAGKTMLDWIGPAAAMLDGAGQPVFKIHSHTLDEIAQWQSEQAGIHEFSPRQQQIAQLQPIAPPKDAIAEQIIARLEYRYPHQNLTHLAAARSVSAISKEGTPRPISSDENSNHVETYESSSLRLPRWLAATQKADPLEIGSATHRVLQYLRFDQCRSREDLENQMQTMISRRLLATEEKPAVQTDAILWLLQSDLGNLLRSYNDRIIREMPIYFSCQPSTFDPSAQGTQSADRIMLRGRLDAMIETDDGLILLDYKTDNASPEKISQLSIGYEKQIGYYRDAITRIGARKIIAAYLVFLTPQILRKVEPV